MIRGREKAARIVDGVFAPRCFKSFLLSEESRRMTESLLGWHARDMVPNTGLRYFKNMSELSF